MERLELWYRASAPVLKVLLFSIVPVAICAFFGFIPIYFLWYSAVSYLVLNMWVAVDAVIQLTEDRGSIFSLDELRSSLGSDEKMSKERKDRILEVETRIDERMKTDEDFRNKVTKSRKVAEWVVRCIIVMAIFIFSAITLLPFRQYLSSFKFEYWFLPCLRGRMRKRSVMR